MRLARCGGILDPKEEEKIGDDGEEDEDEEVEPPPRRRRSASWAAVAPPYGGVGYEPTVFDPAAGHIPISVATERVEVEIQPRLSANSPSCSETRSVGRGWQLIESEALELGAEEEYSQLAFRLQEEEEELLGLKFRGDPLLSAAAGRPPLLPRLRGESSVSG